MFNRKTIMDLKGYSFIVPAYQRGYRWTEKEVIALIQDIAEFSSTDGKKYCLQPLIVKKLKNGKYEVVDGQQRLTTIYIFMKIAQQEIKSALPPFELSYETRSTSQKFLEELSEEKNYDDSNIDYYYISKAYNAINEWFSNQPDRSVAIQELNTKIRKSVFFIWYEIPEESDSITIFTKVNLGKIPLTNAELIKALILSKDNFKEKEYSEKEIDKQQLEISIQWDKIEQGMQEEAFWYFLNEKEREGTRIDLLFEILAKEYKVAYNLNVKDEEKYFSFLVFSEYFSMEHESKNKIADNIWNEIKQLYEELRQWYNDLDKYHIIGYLIATGKTIPEICSLIRKKRKSDAWKELLDASKINYDLRTLYALNYNNNKNKIRELLLLFNIATLISKSEKQYRFPFDIYKKQGWDIEHIHAKADDSDGQVESDDTLGNLTLLDCKTNRSEEYRKEPFDTKRRIIIERESNGQFVPVCTKNVFLKVYTKNITTMENWDEQDKIDYLYAINDTLDKFFNGGQVNE